MNTVRSLDANNGFKASNSDDATPSTTAAAMPHRWMVKHTEACSPEATINANQWTSISAMIAYAAHKSGQPEFRIERDLADHFNVPNAKFLSAADFDMAIRFLADILPA